MPKQLFSWFNSNKYDWNTPKDLYNKLNEEFNFELDPCTTTNNLNCNHYFTKEQDGLKQDWKKLRAFVNPPYVGS